MQEVIIRERTASCGRQFGRKGDDAVVFGEEMSSVRRGTKRAQNGGRDEDEGTQRRGGETRGARGRARVHGKKCARRGTPRSSGNGGESGGAGNGRSARGLACARKRRESKCRGRSGGALVEVT